MIMTEVKSSNIKSIGWEKDTLQVEFKTGATYIYNRVPKGIYERMLAESGMGGSVGRFFDQYVKKAGYTYHELVPVSETVSQTASTLKDTNSYILGRHVADMVCQRKYNSEIELFRSIVDAVEASVKELNFSLKSNSVE